MPKKKMSRETRGKLIESVMDELCEDAGRGSYEVAWDLLSDLNNVELINSMPIKRMREEGWTPYLPKELREEYELESPGVEKDKKGNFKFCYEVERSQIEDAITQHQSYISDENVKKFVEEMDGRIENDVNDTLEHLGEELFMEKRLDAPEDEPVEAPDMTNEDEPKEEEDMKEEEQEKEAPETAADFGDDPKVRHSKGEHKKYAKSEPWEVRYRRDKRAGKRAPVDAASFGDDPKIRHSKGEHTKFNKKEPWEVRYRHKIMGAEGKVLGMPRDTVVTLVGTGLLVAFGLALKMGYVQKYVPK